MTSDNTTKLTRRGLLTAGVGAGATLLLPATEASAATLSYSYQTQSTGSWCSAASTRIALSARGVKPTQGSLAKSLGLVNGHGLQDATLIAKVLNARLSRTSSTHRYHFRMPAAGTLKEQLYKRVKQSIDAGYPVVINMNQVAGDHFSAGHYVAIVGYTSTKYQIADPYRSGRNGTWYPHADVVYWNKLNRFTAFV